MSKFPESSRSLEAYLHRQPLLSVLKAHEFPPTVIRFNPSSTLLVSGSPDNTVRAVVIPENLAGTSELQTPTRPALYAYFSSFQLGLLAL